MRDLLLFCLPQNYLKRTGTLSYLGSCPPAAFQSQSQLTFICDELDFPVIVGLGAILPGGVTIYTHITCLPHISQACHITVGIQTNKPSILLLEGISYTFLSLALHALCAFQLLVKPTQCAIFTPTGKRDIWWAFSKSEQFSPEFLHGPKEIEETYQSIQNLIEKCISGPYLLHGVDNSCIEAHSHIIREYFLNRALFSLILLAIFDIIDLPIFVRFDADIPDIILGNASINPLLDLRLKILNAKIKIISWPSNGSTEVIARSYGDDPKGAFDEVDLRFGEFIQYPADGPISSTDDDFDYNLIGLDGFFEVLYLTGAVLVVEQIDECQFYAAFYGKTR